MEHYEQLEMEIIEIEKKDVICTSGGTPDIWEGEGVNPGFRPIGSRNDQFGRGLLG